MRALKLALIGLVLCACTAWGNSTTTSAGTVTNGSTSTSGALRIVDATSVTYGATFTASSVGTTTMAVEVSWDGATWFPWASASLANTTGTNIRALPIVATATSILIVPGYYARVKLTNNTGASITSTTLGMIAN